MSNLRKYLPVKSRPGGADFCLEVVVDRGTGYTADGQDHLYFRCDIVPDEDDWKDIAEMHAAGDELVEFTAQATPQGRYADADERETTVTWSASGMRS